ncbi:MAG: hypothetical protein R6U84_04405 [Candidatus Cloacimonadales bacterium]
MKNILYLALLLLLISCAPAADSAIGILANEAYEIPIKLAYKAELLAENELGIKNYSSSEYLLKALLNQDLALAILPLNILSQNPSATPKLKKLAYYQREGFAIASADVQYQEVAVLQNSLAALLLENLLRKQEVDFRLRYFSKVADLQKALARGEINAVCLKIPQLFQFENLPHKIWLSQYYGRYPNSILVTTQAAYEANPSYFQTKLEQISSAVQLYNQDLPLAKAAAASFAQIAATDLETFIYQTRFIISYEAAGKDFERMIFAQ